MCGTYTHTGKIGSFLLITKKNVENSALVILTFENEVKMVFCRIKSRDDTRPPPKYCLARWNTERFSSPTGRENERKIELGGREWFNLILFAVASPTKKETKKEIFLGQKENLASPTIFNSATRKVKLIGSSAGAPYLSFHCSGE